MIYSVFSLKIPYYRLFYFGENSLVIIYLENNFALIYFFSIFLLFCSFAPMRLFKCCKIHWKLICSQTSINLNALDCFVLSNISKYANKTPFLWILWRVGYFGVIYCVVFIRYTWRLKQSMFGSRWTVKTLCQQTRSFKIYISGEYL